MSFARLLFEAYRRKTCAAGLFAFAALLVAQTVPIEQAWSLLREGRRPEAVTLLQKMVRENPANADARLLLGSVLMEAGEREESILNLTAGARLKPKSAEAQNALGEAYNAFDDPKSARGPLERAIALDPKFPIARVNLGAALIQTGDMDLPPHSSIARLS